jgi:DNA processing protein
LTPEQALPWLRLTLVPGVTPVQQRALLATLGSAAQIVAGPHGRIAAIVGEDAAKLLEKGPDARLLNRTLDWLALGGHHAIAWGDPAYPPRLAQIADPPALLYARGRSELLCDAMFAIVGSRNATPDGAHDAAAFARELSNAGLVIVSGLALGIDAAAHSGGLGGASSSVAVLGTGVDVTYPRRNAALMQRLCEKGCVVSEFALGTPPARRNFPRRNRLISGLSRGVLVVEAARESGSLSTAASALQQDREVFAIPGSIHSPLAKGCHWLIKEGAKLVENADDILSEIRWRPAEPLERPNPAPRRERDPILEKMGDAPMSLDQIAQRTGLDAAKLAALVSKLELEGRIAALAGGWFQRMHKPRVIE